MSTTMKHRMKTLQKDPFYELEMPIRCELFTNAVENLIERVNAEGVGKVR